jgi:hypothetical protein
VRTTPPERRRRSFSRSSVRTLRALLDLAVADGRADESVGSLYEKNRVALRFCS